MSSPVMAVTPSSSRVISTGRLTLRSSAASTTDATVVDPMRTIGSMGLAPSPASWAMLSLT